MIRVFFQAAQHDFFQLDGNLRVDLPRRDHFLRRMRDHHLERIVAMNGGWPVSM